MRRALLATAAAAALATACGAGSSGTAAPGRERPAESAVALPAAPPQVAATCRSLAASRDVPVRCPPRLPRARWAVSHRSLRSGPCAYLLDLNARPLPRPDAPDGAHHALAGGRCRPFPLRTAAGRWPAGPRLTGDLGLLGAEPTGPGGSWAEQRAVPLRVLRPVRVATHPALLLRAAPYPYGGVHGGHLVAVWNQRGAGHVLSLHFAPGAPGPPRRHEVVLLAAATAMARPGR